MQASAVLSFIPSTLMALLLLGGVILMAVNRRNHGSAAVLGIIGCILLLIGVVSSASLSFLIPTLMRSTGTSISTMVGVWSLVTFLFDAAGTGLLIFAVIARRNPPQDTPPGVPGWQGGPGGQQQAWQQGQSWQQGQGGPQAQGGQQQTWPPNYG